MMEIPPQRRDLHRASPDSTVDVAVELVFQDRRWPTGEIIDATARSISLAFPSGDAPEIPLGDPVTLLVSSSLLAKPISVDGIVTSRLDAPNERRRYGLQFTEAVRTTVITLNRLFSRRRHYRASADPENPVVVTIQPAEPAGAAVIGTALLADISRGGLGIVVKHQVERSLTGADKVRVSFRLPDVTGSLESVAQIRARSIREGQVHLGLEFDVQALGFTSMEQRIQKFVSRRQQAELASKTKT